MGKYECSPVYFHDIFRDLGLGTMDINHLCHNTLCIHLCHLSMEPHTVNCDRVRCVNRGMCKGHAGCPDCLLECKM